MNMMPSLGLRNETTPLERRGQTLSSTNWGEKNVMAKHNNTWSMDIYSPVMDWRKKDFKKILRLYKKKKKKPLQI